MITTNSYRLSVKVRSALFIWPPDVYKRQVLDSTIYELKVVDHETTTATLGNVKEKIPDTGIDSNNSPLYIGLIGGAALVCAITLGVHNRRKAKR